MKELQAVIEDFLVRLPTSPYTFGGEKRKGDPRGPLPSMKSC